MKAVVTGSAGFIGTHLVDELVERGYRVSGIDRQSRPGRPGYEHHLLDLADEASRRCLPEIVAGADLVFHLAARPGVRGGGTLVDEQRRRDNVDATCRLLGAIPLSTPVVATSSSSVYGGSRLRPDGLVASRETDALRPRGGYARSKVEMERLCAARRDRGGLVAVIRPFTVAGEGQRPDMAFSIWLDALRRGEPIRILGSPDRRRDVTDIRDVVEGLLRAGERGVNGTVNLGTGVAHRLLDMARALLAVSGRGGEVSIQPGWAEEVDATLADTTRCAETLGFVPHTDLVALLRRQVEAAAPMTAMVGT